MLAFVAYQAHLGDGDLSIDPVRALALRLRQRPTSWISDGVLSVS
ncbi:MAG: hypothetical protein M5U08_15960 [Burkholderiales bacterium]|nr:hypothetical protein [Burkholderiales bacterium]